MRRNIVIGLLAGILVILGIFVFVMSGDDTPLATQTETKKQTSIETTEPQNKSNPGDNSGVYIDYEENAIAQSSGEKVLFFHAPWCPQCRKIEADIKEQGVPTGFTVIKVDYDTNQALRQQYGVTLQTTFVKVDDQGNELDKYVAYDEPTFDAVKENIF